MDKDLNRIIQSDIYRCFGQNRISFRTRLTTPTIRCQIAFRKATYYSCNNRKILAFFSKLRYFRLRNKYSFSIPVGTKIGEGLCVGHTGSVIINGQVIMGRNINIATGVVIGATYHDGKAETPVFGNYVWVGSNAIIVGGITVGDDVLIAPGAFVNFDVPSHSVVIGNPGIIHRKENATKSYITNTIE